MSKKYQKCIDQIKASVKEGKITDAKAQELLAWMEGVLAHEMKRLPYAVENSAVFQGRCQMLVELVEFAKEAPAVAAKLK